MYQVCLQHMILSYCVENGDLLGTEVDDGHWCSIMSHYQPSHTEPARIKDCNFKKRNARAGKK